MKKISFVSAHVVSDVVEDTLDLLIMWCDERYAYDDRPYEQIPCDEVAAKYLATIACCLQVAVNAHDYRTLCNRYAQGLVEEYQHELDNTKEEIEMAQELDRFAEELEEDYEDELEAGRIRDEQRNDFVSTHVASEFVCDYCGGVFSLPAYAPLFGKGQVCFRCHKEANNNIESMADNVTSRTKLEDARMVLEITKAELEGIKAELDTYDNERDYCNGWTMREVQEDLMRDTMTELVKVIEELEEEIEMTNEVKKYQTMCRNCGEVFDVWVSDEDLNKPQFYICEDCVAEEEIEMMNEEDCMAEEERFPAGENHIDVCHRCGFVFEVQDLIPVERYRGFGGDNHNIAVFLCKACFEEEYHTVLE